MEIAGARVPPAPWSNIIANPNAGFCITERGGGFAWAENSYFYRLTPWHNDPVSDPVGEVLYLRDARERIRVDADTGAVAGGRCIDRGRRRTASVRRATRTRPHQLHATSATESRASCRSAYPKPIR